MKGSNLKLLLLIFVVLLWGCQSSPTITEQADASSSTETVSRNSDSIPFEATLPIHGYWQQLEDSEAGFSGAEPKTSEYIAFCPSGSLEIYVYTGFPVLVGADDYELAADSLKLNLGNQSVDLSHKVLDDALEITLPNGSTMLYRRLDDKARTEFVREIDGGSCQPPRELPSTSDGLTQSQSSPLAVPSDYRDLPILIGQATVEMRINDQTVTLVVDGNSAPVTAGNFIDLVQRGVYDGVVFHRVVKTPEPFVVQGGDPQSKDPSVPPQRLGTGSFNDPETNEPRYIPLEIRPEGAETAVYSQTFEDAGVNEYPLLSHTRGAVAMARSQLPDSASAQFYFALADLSFLDGSYAVFGYVTEGMDVIDEIAQGDIVESATVVSGIENLQQPE